MLNSSLGFKVCKGTSYMEPAAMQISSTLGWFLAGLDRSFMYCWGPATASVARSEHDLMLLVAKLWLWHEKQAPRPSNVVLPLGSIPQICIYI